MKEGVAHLPMFTPRINKREQHSYLCKMRLVSFISLATQVGIFFQFGLCENVDLAADKLFVLVSLLLRNLFP